MNLICAECRRPLTPRDVKYRFYKGEWRGAIKVSAYETDGGETPCCHADVVNADGSDLTADQSAQLEREAWERLQDEMIP